MRHIEAYSYSCLMMQLPTELADRVRAFGNAIADGDIYDGDEGEQGREDDPHVTVKYGLHTDSADLVSDTLAMSNLNEVSSIVEIVGMSAFHNEEYVVLKLDVESLYLNELHRALSDELANSDSHPEYHPHVTIAYLKHREDDPYWYEKLYSDMFNGEVFTNMTLRFTTPAKQEFFIEMKTDEIEVSEPTAIAASLVKIAKSLTARVIDTKYTSTYKALLKEARRLPWDSKPGVYKQSAAYSMDGTINGKVVAFTWHQPSTEWGPSWFFTGMFVDHKEVAGYNHRDETNLVPLEIYNDVPMAWLKWVKQGEPGLNESIQRKNISDFKDAIAIAKKI